MKTKLAVILILICLVTLFFTIGKDKVNSSDQLVSPFFGILHSETKTSPTPSSNTNAPRTFQFDSSTDLNLELEKVNPEVLESDFSS